ncbi:DUF6332 family protein [Streptomyces sp. NBC_00178]|uniref:DUF6332 family protein n=1 Tax=Streptomyces sp. NBC_00178 TaxID=2975672 RepID=UPI002E28A566|nr:DUF6332 family protein [Streptomyces sp. NBC_00178]
MQHRTQADRDAATVETGYALVSGAFVAVATFVGVSLPALLLELPDTGERLLMWTGAVLGALAFVVRVVYVLLRFRRRSGIHGGQLVRPGARGGRPNVTGTRVGQPAQSSQPGRTSPDS